jgi:hypothetical protein
MSSINMTQTSNNTGVSNTESNTSEELGLIFNIILHVFVLFAVLTMLYILVVAPMEESSFNSTIQGIISTQVNTVLQSEDQTVVKTAITNNMPILQGLTRYYNIPDPTRVNNNKWVFNTSYMLLTVLGAFLVFLLLVLFFGGRITSVAFGKILLTNIFVFGLIGIVEYLFFTQIAFKYEPVTESQIVNTIANSVNNY